MIRTGSRDPQVDPGLAGEVVIATGAARGIGRATAELLAAAGALVLAVDLDEEVRDVVRALPGDGHRALVADLADLATHEGVVAAASAMGPLRGIAHMAGVLRRRSSLADVSEDDWDFQHDVNLKAAFFLCRTVGTALQSAGRGGRIVAFASQGWWSGGFGGSVVYAASKGGVVSFVRGLARTYGAGRHHGQRRRTGSHRHADDAGRHDRRGHEGDGRRGSARSPRAAVGGGRAGPVPAFGPGLVRFGRDAQRERRLAHVLNAMTRMGMASAIDTEARTVELTMGEAINRALGEALEREPDMMLLGQDIGAYGGTFGVTRGLFDRYGDDVVRDCAAVRVGHGGLRHRARDRRRPRRRRDRVLRLRRRGDGPGLQPGREAALLHGRQARGAARHPLPIVARMGMGPQHSQSLEAWFMHIPGLKIAMPADAPDAYGLMRTALLDRNPVLFIENVRLYGRRAAVDLDADPDPLRPGAHRCARAATPPSSALSGMVHEALAAADELAQRGISVEVIDPRTLAPFDMETIVASVKTTQHLVVTHDAHRTCGVGCGDRSAVRWSRPSTTSTRRSSASAASTCPVPSGPAADRGLPDADGIVAAVERSLARGAA